jgi:hypothetical protein
MVVVTVGGSRRASAFCREVAAMTPGNYDPANAGCFSAPTLCLTPSMGSDAPPLFWRNACVTFSIDMSPGSSNPSRFFSLNDARGAADDAFSAWSNHKCANGFPASISAYEQLPVNCSEVPSRGHNNPIIFRDAAWPYNDSANALGYTTLTVDLCTGEIVGAAIEINSSNNNLVVRPPAPAGSYDLQTILTHEAGHFLGLAHSDQSSAIMYAYYHSNRDAGATAGSSPLTADDIAGLCAIYDPSGQRNPGPFAQSAMTCDTNTGFISTSCGPPRTTTTAVGSGSQPVSDGGSDAGGSSADGGDGSCYDTLFTCTVGRAFGGSTEPRSRRPGRTRAPLLGATIAAVLFAGRARRRRRRAVALCALGCGSLGGGSLGCGSVNNLVPAPSDAAPFDAASARFDGAGSGSASGGQGDGASGAATGAPADGGAIDASGSPSDGASGETSAPPTGQPVALPPPTSALLRVANWSPDSPAVDVCIAPHGTGAFQGPMVASLAASSMTDAGSASLSFPFVSAYTVVPPGQYDARIVVAGAGSCAAGIGSDATSLLSLKAGDAETVALVGDVQPSGSDVHESLVGFADDVASGSGLLLRFINGAPSFSFASLGTGSLATNDFVPIFQGVVFGRASTPDESSIRLSVDARGYSALAALSGVTLSAHALGAATEAVSSTNFSGPAAAVLTIVLVSGKTGGAPARLLECADNAGTVGPFSDCAILP